MRFLNINISDKTASNGFWSLVANIAGVVAGLATLKIVTRFIAPGDYGQVGLTLGIIVLLNNLLIGPVMTMHMRVYFEYLEKKMGRWYSNTFNFILLVVGILAVAIYALVGCFYSPKEGRILLDLLIPASVLIMAQVYLGSLMNYLEAHRLYQRLALVTVINKLSYPATLALLIFLARIDRPWAILLSQGLAILPALMFFSYITEQKASDARPLSDKIERRALKTAFTDFGFALPLGYLVHWVLSTSDRYLIGHYLTLQEVGIYVINCGLWSTPFLMLSGWLEIWTRPYIYERASQGKWTQVRSILAKRLLVSVGGGLLGTGLILALRGMLTDLFIGENYLVTAKFVTVVCFGQTCLVAGSSILPLFLACKKASTILAATSAAAVTSIYLNLLLIPKLGILASAVSALTAYLVWMLVLGGSAIYMLRNLIKPAKDTEAAYGFKTI